MRSLIIAIPAPNRREKVEMNFVSANTLTAAQIQKSVLPRPPPGAADGFRYAAETQAKLQMFTMRIPSTATPRSASIAWIRSDPDTGAGAWPAGGVSDIYCLFAMLDAWCDARARYDAK